MIVPLIDSVGNIHSSGTHFKHDDISRNYTGLMFKFKADRVDGKVEMHHQKKIAIIIHALRRYFPSSDMKYYNHHHQLKCYR